MNSKIKLIKLGRKKSVRKSLKKNLVGSLLVYEHMKTTKAKAKAVVKEFDHVINMAKSKDQDLAKRKLKELLFDDNAINKLFDVYKKRFADQTSGYVKMYNIGLRKGDKAPLVQLFVKGYEYKDIGKKTRKSVKKQETPEKEETTGKTPALIDQKNKKDQARSQIGAKSVQGKIKSRSGI